MPQPLTLAATVAQTLPEGGMIPLFIGVAAGLALWLAGVKIVRAVFLAVGAAAGGFAGATIVPLTGMPPLDLGALTVTPGFAGLIVGGMLGALVAVAMLRLVVTLTAAAAMATVGAMAALVFLHFNPGAPGDAPAEQPGYAESAPESQGFTDDLARRAREQTGEAMDLLDRALPEDAPASALLDDLNTEENRERIRNAAERSRAFLQGVYDRLQADFQARPARDRLIILSSTLAGLAFGLLVGVAMPKRSSALVTSLAGSALWLAAAVALVRANTDPDPGFITQPPVAWASIWGVAAIIGMAVQFGLIKRKGAKPAGEQPDD